jgi:hypothetical protein
MGVPAFYILDRSCYNAHIMTTAFEYLLQKSGFEPAGPDLWGKVVGEATAFVDIGATETTAWAWLPETEVYLGPKLVLQGVPDDTVPAALSQLALLLTEEDLVGSVTRAFPAALEQVAVLPAC